MVWNNYSAQTAEYTQNKDSRNLTHVTCNFLFNLDFKMGHMLMKQGRPFISRKEKNLKNAL